MLKRGERTGLVHRSFAIDTDEAIEKDN